MKGFQKISGINCIVNLEEQNKMICGTVSCGISRKPFNIKFKPFSTRKSFNVKEELRRLYFDIGPSGIKDKNN